MKEHRGRLVNVQLVAGGAGRSCMLGHVKTDVSIRAPRVGMVGAGQLARMTYQAAISLGISLKLLAERPDDGAALIASDVALGSPDSYAALSSFVGGCDVTTFDHELVNAQHLQSLERDGHAFRPSADVVALVQNKRSMRERLDHLGFPVPPFRPVSNLADLLAFAERHGWPTVAKSIRGGYDGRGVWVLDTPAAAESLVQVASEAGIDLLAEAFVPIERELAIVVARRPGGQALAYPLVETVQRNGICRELLVPARVTPTLAEQARLLGLSIVESIGAVGILAVELFVTEGRLLVNELAARPHNSGHFSIEGSQTSQFENHLRAVLDWPLGSTELVAPAVATVNVLGGANSVEPIEQLASALADPAVRVHLYGKQARPGRKLGHVTVLAADLESALSRARRAAASLVTSSAVEATS
jgi:5-(carboxyamino)imidazole ribonucleotide synthase